MGNVYKMTPTTSPIPIEGDRIKRLFRSESTRPLALLERCPAHAKTPLRGLPELAERYGVGRLWAKDETTRMSLGSFKALGGAFAVAQMIADAAGTADLLGTQAARVASGMTFVTASAGNHGISVAAGARIFGSSATIVLSRSVPTEFADRLQKLGAEVHWVDGNYEDSVAEAIELARSRGWLLLADGSWEGYIERPALVLEGYTVLPDECMRSYAEDGVWPTHVFLQAGVGGLAAAVAAHIRDFWPQQPHIVVVEPDAAPCLKASMEAGSLIRADGPVSNMGRLDCKDASLISFHSLSVDADHFVTVSDAQAAEAAEALASVGLQTTPSGSAGLAGLASFAPGPDSRCLIVVSEGPLQV